MAPPTASISSVLAADGATLSYTSIGQGPDVVIVHGSMQQGASQADLAALLAGSFRVHLVDRRGRAGSGPYAVDAGTEQEVADLRAVLAATGARRVFGVSSGAIIAARTALVDPAIERLALFEPPLAIAGSMRLDLVRRLHEAAEGGRLPTSMAIGMKVSEMGPAWMFGLPVPVLAAASRAMLRRDGIRALGEALPVDVRVVTENADRGTDFAALAVPTLLMVGTATRPYLRTAVDALARTIPGARTVELDGQWHGVTQNRSDRGRPELVAPALLDFFA